MSNINKQALREAAEKATPGLWVEICGEVTTADYEVEGVTFLDHICNCEIIGTESQNAEFIAAANPATVLALLNELEAAEKRIAELKEALKQSVSGYKSCLRTGHERIIELGGDCDAPEMMIARNPDIQQAEKVLSAGIITKVGE